MEIIDAHCHIPGEPENWDDYSSKDYDRIKENPDTFVEEVTIYMGYLYKGNKDIFGETQKRKIIIDSINELYRYYKKIGINRVILSSFAAQQGRKIKHLKNGNERVRIACDKYPDMFIGCCAVNPNLLNESLIQIDEYVKKRDFRMLGEISQFYHMFQADDGKIFPIVEKAIELNVPLLFNSFCKEHQKQILLLAKRYKDGKFIMSNMGGTRCWRAGIETVASAENLYLDYSGISAASNPGLLEYAISVIGKEKLIFGTDFYSIEPASALQNVMHSTISEEEKETILSGNIKKIANIS